MAATVVQSPTKPDTKQQQFHRLVILGKFIPIDVIKSLLLKRILSSKVCQLVTNSPAQFK